MSDWERLNVDRYGQIDNGRNGWAGVIRFEFTNREDGRSMRLIGVQHVTGRGRRFDISFPADVWEELIPMLADAVRDDLAGVQNPRRPG